MTDLLPDPDLLSLGEQVAQMLVVRASGHLFDHQIQYPSWEPPADVLQHWLQDLRVGGVIFLGGSAGELAWRCQQVQDWAAIPLFLAADIEEGVGQRFAGATGFPPPLALAAIAQRPDGGLEQAQSLAYEMGAWTAQEAAAIGLNWVLAPVVDVNNNPQNPVINVRAFGETPEMVSQLATAFIQGTQPYPVLTTAKHFPGHGDTATDSHLELPVIPHGCDRLRRTEYPPFQAAIAAHVDGVMSAHLLIPALDPEYPATLSNRILTGELRQALGFTGLIVTDALVMGAIANQYGANEAAVLAVAAGADILMMPADPPGAITAICAAVEQGRIQPEQIQASLERIWRAKQKITTYPAKPSDPPTGELSTSMPIDLDRLATADAFSTATAILKASQRVQGCITTVPANARTLIVVDDLLSCEFLGRKAPAIDRPRQQGYQVQIIDGNTPDIPLETTTTQPTFLQLFIRGNPFRGSTQLSSKAQAWFEFLLATHQLQALAIYGSPYALAQFQSQLSEDIPCAFSYGQMPLAQNLLLNQFLTLSGAEKS